MRGDEDAFIELAEQYKTQPYQNIIRDAKAILGLPHHLSVPPGGIVITPGALTDLVPTQMATKGVTITQLDLDSIERMGLVKIDLLGIRGLTVLGDVAQAITETRKADHTLPRAQKGVPALASPASPLLEALEAIPEDDPATSALLQRGDTIGCFQIESLGMRATLREIRAHSVDDLMIALLGPERCFVAAASAAGTRLRLQKINR